MIGTSGPRRLFRSLGAALVATSLLAACAGGSGTPSAAEADPEFVAWFFGIGEEIKADPNYNRMPIDTDAQGDEFSYQLHRAYRGEITTAQFADWANTTYPGHAYEVAFFTQRLPG